MPRTRLCTLLVPTLFLGAFISSPGQNQEYSSSTPWRGSIHTSRFRSLPTTDTLEARGAYTDSLSGITVPIDSPGYTEPMRSKGVPKQREELPVNEADTVVVASFLDHDTYMSPTHKSVYTTVYLAPKNVFKTSTHVSVGVPITLLLLGGSIQTSSGAVIKTGLNASTSVLIPGHKYLIFLKYHQQGDFFTEVKAWELRGGKAFPTAGDDLDRSYRHESQYAGRPESSILSAVSDLASK